MVPGAEGTEIGCLRAAAGAAQESDFRVFLSDCAGIFLDAIDLAHNQLCSCLRVFADHARVVGIGHRFGKLVLDQACGISGFAGLMDARVPGVFDRVTVQAGHFDTRPGSQCAATKAGQCHAGRKARQNSATHGVGICHSFSNRSGGRPLGSRKWNQQKTLSKLFKYQPAPTWHAAAHCIRP